MSRNRPCEIQRMATGELATTLRQMVRALHPAILLCRTVEALVSARKEFEQTVDAGAVESTQAGATSSRLGHASGNLHCAQKMSALEHIVDLCLTEAEGYYVCRAHELNTLVEYAIAYIEQVMSESSSGILRDLGDLRHKYERAIRCNMAVGDVAVPTTSEEVRDIFQVVYEENREYLCPTFERYLGFSWEGFVEVVENLASHFLHGVGFVSQPALRQTFEETQEADAILEHLTYTPLKARQRMGLKASVRHGAAGRLLLAHPLPSVQDHVVVSGKLLSDSFNWHVYTFRKKSHAFLKAKGHMFEAMVVRSLEMNSWSVLARNLVVNEQIVPGEQKAEYDIIAARCPYLIIIEAKAYAPETRKGGYSRSHRKKLAAEFGRKLRLKAEFIREHLSELPIDAPDCRIIIPVLLSTYPLAASSNLEGVAVLTSAEFPAFLSAPNIADESVQIRLA